MKKTDTVLKEYVKKLSDDTLFHLNSRITQNLCGDLAEVATILSQDKAVDYFLLSATSSDELFNLLDIVADVVKKEVAKRNGTEK